MSKQVIVDAMQVAAYILADDIESGRLIPGKLRLWADIKSGIPNCTLGHLASRTGRWLPDLGPEAWWLAVSRANDRDNWAEVVRLLRARGEA